MMLANLRARFAPNDTDLVVELLADGDTRHEQELWDRIEREGVDALLDEPSLPARLRDATGLIGPSAALFLYVWVRHALLRVDIDDYRLSDYLGALLLEFGRSHRAYQIARHDDETFRYLTDIVAAIESQSGRRGFLLRVHLGNFSLWLAGMFPEYIATRRRRNGAPGIPYYEALGVRGFRLASDHQLAQAFELADVYESAAECFPALREALNRLSDELVFPGCCSADRLLRQVADEFNRRCGR